MIVKGKFLGQRVKNVVSGGSSAQPVYFTTLDSDITGYKQLSYTAESTEHTLTATLDNQELLLRTYLYPDHIDVTTIPAGKWNATYRAKVSKTQGITQIKFEAFLRHEDNTETTLFSDYCDDIENTDWQTKTKETTQPQFSCALNDRFGVRIYGKTTGSNVTLDTIVGDGNGSYFTTTLAQRHSTLRDLDFEHSGHTGFQPAGDYATVEYADDTAFISSLLFG